MWPFTSYPVSSPSDVHERTYDYVIVGAPCIRRDCRMRGCIASVRGPHVSVLVIDKGHVKDNLISRIPLLSQHMFLGSLLQVQGDRWTEPIPSAKMRRNRLWAVEGIGGVSRINAMLWTRGFPADYDAWADLGLNEWTYEKIEPYFKRMESTLAHPHSESRGHEGAMEMRGVTFPFLWTEYFRRAALELGLKSGKDINDPTEAPAMGVFDLDVAIDKQGKRVSALTAYINKDIASQRHVRLTICTGAVASRLEADAQKGIVTGVHIQSSKHPHAGYFVKARREVILCAGAVCTPQILLLSGIGSPESSEKHDIPLVKDLPAVGATFFDHYSIPILLEVPKKESIHRLESLWGIWHMLLWLLFGKGLMSLGSMSSTMFLRSDAIDQDTMEVKNKDDAGHDLLNSSLSRNVPDIEIMLIATNSVEREVPGHKVISVYPTLVQPRGSGRVELASTDALAQPRITYPLFTNEHDIKTARLAVRFAMRLVEKLQHSDYPYPTKLLFAPGQDRTALTAWEKAAPPEYIPMPMPASSAKKMQVHAPNTSPEGAKTWKTVTDDEIDDYMERVGHTSLHFSATCPMSNDEKTGVVDQRLRVHGFKNLRIADTSMFPRIPSCHTMAPVMAVAERCADFIKST